MDKKAYLIVLDGFGLGEKTKGNAIALANTPYLDEVFSKYPMSRLKTDGESVGLPEYQTGGSEVGHITMSSGRQIDQLLKKINDTVADDSFFADPKLKPLFEKAFVNGRIHLMGLCSDGGVHSYLPHLLRLQQMASEFQIKDVFIHAFLDGRDVGERTASSYLEQIDAQNIGQIASIGGRFYGMDRDTNWDRTEVAYKTMCNVITEATEQSWQEYLQQTYQESDKSDYYVPPVLLNSDGQIRADDVVILFNFRTDRARQISEALGDPSFNQFNVPVQISADNFAIFGPYFDPAVQPFSFEDVIIDNTLGEVVSAAGGKQLRISETEKFNHVTFFFSGQRIEEFVGENRILVPSPKCPSYAEKPEMSAREQTEEAMKAIKTDDYMLVVQNYANSDLVGHSGDLEAAIKAIETLDECLAKLIPEALKYEYEVFITADHGNSESMITDDGQPNNSHTRNLVPFSWINVEKKLADTGDLSDVAPTLLEVLSLDTPDEMTGKSLIR